MAKTGGSSNHTTYGNALNASGVVRFLDHVLQVNRRQLPEGVMPFPVCIWGAHGVGKTQLAEQFARDRDLDFVYLAPAQFEEMGDLIGLPVIEHGRTAYRPPVWAPLSGKAGILLLDDVNRADDRILRGLMPLLQYYGLPGWKLPPDWFIILTANPDTGDYSVTPLDPAFLTRLLHITMVFDADEWAVWAAREGLPEAGIHFVLAHPELVEGERTTARSLSQFFRSVSALENPMADPVFLHTLGNASLDSLTTAAFIEFLEQGGDRIPGPARILGTDNFFGEVGRPLYQLARKKPEAAAAVCRRLVLFLRRGQGLPDSPLFRSNLKAFVMQEVLNPGLRFALLRDLATVEHPGIAAVLQDPEIGRLAL
ncbi:MAG: AAA family ATPase [Haliscomenobacter sp.]|nr:AAA family ATPase [Haliscomenobacter sp.]MBK8878813.1 AAA family ATPase [Haliscomenobacter sp.]